MVISGRLIVHAPVQRLKQHSTEQATQMEGMAKGARTMERRYTELRDRAIDFRTDALLSAAASLEPGLWRSRWRSMLEADTHSDHQLTAMPYHHLLRMSADMIGDRLTTSYHGQRGVNQYRSLALEWMPDIPAAGCAPASYFCSQQHAHASNS